MGAIPISRLDFLDYMVSFAEDMLRPPGERGLLDQLVDHGILGELDRKGILKVLEWNP